MEPACRPGTAAAAAAVIGLAVVLAVRGVARVPAGPGEAEGPFLGARLRAWYRGVLTPLETELVTRGVHPDAITWAQLGIHSKPCALLNIDSYFDPFLSFLDHTVDQGFVDPQSRALVLVADEPSALLDAMRRYEPAPFARWLDDAQR